MYGLWPDQVKKKNQQRILTSRSQGFPKAMSFIDIFDKIMVQSFTGREHVLLIPKDITDKTI